MRERDDEKIRAILKKAFPPVNAELGRDLWPAVLRKLDEPGAPVPWYDWAMVALLAALFLFYPEFVPVLLYHV